MTTPITITVHYSTQAYHCRLIGIAASSTMAPRFAAQRLADKVFGEGMHQVRMIRDCTASAPGEWEITPIARAAASQPRWRPHTEHPTEHCAAVIAVPVEGLDDDEAASPLLMPRVFNWHPIHGWAEEETDHPLLYPEFWWMPESDLLASLMPALEPQA